MKLAVDFGATKVVIAHLDNRGEPLVFNLGNDGLVPCSVFLNTDGSLLFGEIADSRAASYPAHYLRAFKLQLGSNLPVLGDLKAEQLVTEFLKHLFEKVKSDATFRNAHIESVLLTCPVDFTPSQRELLVTAVKKAGAEEVELVTEPESAGVAFCHYSPDTAFKERALVVDWGGSTLDVALVSRSDKFRVLESRYTAGDNTIGGEVFDDCLASYILQNLPRTVILTPVEWWEIMKDVRRVKCELSAAHSAEFSRSVCDRNITVQISREKFESLISQHVQKAVTLVKKLLDDLSSDEQPEMLVLVGGTTLIPCIKEKLEAATGLPTRNWADARVAVAKGAALLTRPEPIPQPRGKYKWLYNLFLYGGTALWSTPYFLSGNNYWTYGAFLWFLLLPIMRCVSQRRWGRLIWFTPLHTFVSFCVIAGALLLHLAYVPVSDEWLANAVKYEHPLKSVYQMWEERLLLGSIDSELLSTALQDGVTLSPALIYSAAERGSVAGVKLLLRHGVDVNVDVNGDTPLLVATRNGYVECVKWLLAYGADASLSSNNGETAYEIACKLGNEELKVNLYQTTPEGKIKFIESESKLEKPYLYNAVNNGDILEFLLCLQGGASVNAICKTDGATALMLAIQQNRKEFIDVLLAREDTDVKIADNNRKTPLHIAAAKGMSSVIPILLSKGADVNAQAAYGITPLMESVTNRQSQSVCALLQDKDININLQDDSGASALEIAAILGYTDGFKCIFDNPEISKSIAEDALCKAIFSAARYGYTDIVKACLNTGKVKPDTRDAAGRTLMHEAAFHGQLDIINLLLEYKEVRMQINEQDSLGDSPLMSAMYGLFEDKVPDVVRILLSVPEVDVNVVNKKDRDTPLLRAVCRENSEELVKLLLAHEKIDVNVVNKKDGDTPLLRAIYRENSEELVKLLLNHKDVDINIVDGRGNNLLDFAVASSDNTLLMTLLACPRLDVNKTSIYGWTALHKIAYTDEVHPPLFDLLKQPELKVNLLDENGNSPLHLSAIRGSKKALAALLSCSETDVNLLNGGGGTALHIALYTGDAEAVKLLLAHHGIAVNKPDGKEGKTALQIAESIGQEEIAELLRAAGAK